MSFKRLTVHPRTLGIQLKLIKVAAHITFIYILYRGFN